MRTTMMTSSSDPESPLPWAQFEVADGVLSATMTEIKGHLPAGSNQNVTPVVAGEGEDFSSEMYCLALANDGTVSLVPLSKLEAEYLAFLAWYNQGSGEWDRLEFVEAPPVSQEVENPDTE